MKRAWLRAVTGSHKELFGFVSARPEPSGPAAEGPAVTSSVEASPGDRPGEPAGGIHRLSKCDQSLPIRTDGPPNTRDCRLLDAWSASRSFFWASTDDQQPGDSRSWWKPAQLPGARWHGPRGEGPGSGGSIGPDRRDRPLRQATPGYARNRPWIRRLSMFCARTGAGPQAWRLGGGTTSWKCPRCKRGAGPRRWSRPGRC